MRLIGHWLSLVSFTRDTMAGNLAGIEPLEKHLKIALLHPRQRQGRFVVLLKISLVTFTRDTRAGKGFFFRSAGSSVRTSSGGFTFVTEIKTNAN